MHIHSCENVKNYVKCFFWADHTGSKFEDALLRDSDDIFSSDLSQMQCSHHI